MLSAGQSLSVPVGVISNQNNAGVFKPYDPATATGDLSPTTAKPPNKSGDTNNSGDTISISARLGIFSYTNQIGYTVTMPASIRPAPRALCSSLAKARPVPRRAEAGPHFSPSRWLGGALVRPRCKSRAGGYADRATRPSRA